MVGSHHCNGPTIKLHTFPCLWVLEMMIVMFYDIFIELQGCCLACTYELHIILLRRLWDTCGVCFATHTSTPDTHALGLHQLVVVLPDLSICCIEP